MPPRRYSLFQFSLGVEDDDGKLFLTEREPYRFRQLADTIEHTVKVGETLFSLAARYYAGMQLGSLRPDQLWKVIGDFQPTPIVDPTCPPRPGSLLYVPSRKTVRELILNESRQQTAT